MFQFNKPNNNEIKNNKASDETLIKRRDNDSEDNSSKISDSDYQAKETKNNNDEKLNTNTNENVNKQDEKKNKEETEETEQDENKNEDETEEIEQDENKNEDETEQDEIEEEDETEENPNITVKDSYIEFSIINDTTFEHSKFYDKEYWNMVGIYPSVSLNKNSTIPIKQTGGEGNIENDTLTSPYKEFHNSMAYLSRNNPISYLFKKKTEPDQDKLSTQSPNVLETLGFTSKNEKPYDHDNDPNPLPNYSINPTKPKEPTGSLLPESKIFNTTPETDLSNTHDSTINDSSIFYRHIVSH